MYVEFEVLMFCVQWYVYVWVYWVYGEYEVVYFFVEVVFEIYVEVQLVFVQFVIFDGYVGGFLDEVVGVVGVDYVFCVDDLFFGGVGGVFWLYCEFDVVVVLYQIDGFEVVLYCYVGQCFDFFVEFGFDFWLEYGVVCVKFILVVILVECYYWFEFVVGEGVGFENG